MEDLSIDEIRVIWTAAADTTKRKRNEIKSGLKKGTRVAWDHSQHGREVTGTVVRRGGKFVIVQPDGDTRTWKKWPDSLRVIA
jgi:cytochrome c-type biogenesis protein CcmH/NrfF